MSKKRPRTRPALPGAASRAGSKQDPKYWRNRLFKCRYIYKGKRFEVRNWSVKIQHLGIRKTFALASSRRTQAAAEACELYRVLVAEGWEKTTGQSNRTSPQANPWPGDSGQTRRDRFDADYWAQRLIHRQYAMDLPAAGDQELSVRVEHGGTGYYFPLGTNHHSLAMKRALQVYRAVAGQGWEVASGRFPRELTLAFRWFDSPLAWTYTTIHTQISAPRSAPPETPNPAAGAIELAIAESDAGIRRALEWCIRRMDGFCCAATYAGAEELLRGLRQKPVHLVLISHNLADKPGPACLDEMRVAAPGVSGLLYSVYEDSEELFRATPGGAGTYLLRRLPPNQFLEPIAGWLKQGRPLGEGLAPAVWQYFKDGVAAMPVGGSARQLADLTQREHEVLGLLSKGHPDKDIADRLDISVYTVHEHVRNIFDKLGAHNRTEAAVRFLHK
jgi:DNA-binding NarL/FixJ family response regulator